MLFNIGDAEMTVGELTLRGVAGSDLDFARVMGVLDATVSVPAAEPLLARPAGSRRWPPGRPRLAR